MTDKSMRDVAFDLLQNKKKPVTFKKLWEEVSQIMGFSAEVANQEIGNFYTQLSLDGRLVMLPENTWDLRNRHPFDMNVIYSFDDELEEAEEPETEVEEEVPTKLREDFSEEKETFTEELPEDVVPDEGF